MPLYDYECPNCGKIKENISHPIAELESPSVETAKEITCKCKRSGVRMVLFYGSAPSIKTPTRNRFLDGSRRKRNHNHFKREVLPTISDPFTKKMHLKKLSKS